MWCEACLDDKEAAYCYDCLACAYEEGEIAQVYDDHVHCDDVYELTGLDESATIISTQEGAV